MAGMVRSGTDRSVEVEPPDEGCSIGRQVRDLCVVVDDGFQGQGMLLEVGRLLV